MNLIKNNTPYLGKMRVMFESNPYYTGADKRGFNMLNKVHYDFGFTKLISRLYPTKSPGEGTAIDPDKVALIELHTDGVIQKYQWWTIKKKDDTIVETIIEPTKEEGDITFHGELPNSFMTKDGDYIGDIGRGWWYFTNNFRICEEYPRGVAEQYKMIDDVPVTTGYYGFSHRGGQLFKIGDRKFNSRYNPIESDFTKEEWAELEAQVKEANTVDPNSLDVSDRKPAQIRDFVNFTQRGKVVITTWKQAIEAAKNLSKYLS